MFVPAQVWHRVMRIRDPIGGDRGSAFVVEVDGEEFICTAAHVFGGAALAKIEIRYNRSWLPVEVHVVGVGSPADDVLVLAAATGFRRIERGALEVRTSRAEMAITQDAFLLGYPFGWEAYATEAGGAWPFPTVKRAIIAGLPTDEYPRKLLLDCQSNPGFSGGPIALNIPGTQDWTFAGVIQGTHLAPISQTDQSASVRVPSGFCVATQIDCVTNLIAGRASDAATEEPETSTM